jgi:hypothetical protein
MTGIFQNPGNQVVARNSRYTLLIEIKHRKLEGCIQFLGQVGFLGDPTSIRIPLPNSTQFSLF